MVLDYYFEGVSGDNSEGIGVVEGGELIVVGWF